MPLTVSRHSSLRQPHGPAERRLQSRPAAGTSSHTFTNPVGHERVGRRAPGSRQFSSCSAPWYWSPPGVGAYPPPGRERHFLPVVQGLTRRLCPVVPGICPVTARTVQGMAPYPGQASCLALGFWPECFRRLDVKGGRRTFPEETRSALDIEGKHVTIQGPSPALTPVTALHLPPLRT